MRTIAARTESAGWRAVTKSRRAWRAIRMRMEEAMCRIGAIKSKVPVEPAKALYLMLPQQEGHDNSGYAMVMQDLYGVFEGHKDKPLLSLACTPRGVRMVDAYMAEQGFEQVLEWLPDVDRRPGLDIKAMPCYVFRNYEYPEAYRGRPQAEREELLLDTRLALRRMLEKDGQGFVYSFWPDVLTLKEIGDPRDIAAYFRLWDEEGPLRAKSIVTQCRQNTNYDIVRMRRIRSSFRAIPCAPTGKTRSIRRIRSTRSRCTGDTSGSSRTRRIFSTPCITCCAN